MLNIRYSVAINQERQKERESGREAEGEKEREVYIDRNAVEKYM